jgi:hypothetical protein
MSAILIYGASGCGKSSSIRNLPIDKTCVISATAKDLPFKGGKKILKKHAPTYGAVRKALDEVVADYDYIIIDDYSMIQFNQFNTKINEKGWEKFNDFTKSFSDNLESIMNLVAKYPDKFFIITGHEGTGDTDKRIKMKTVGKAIENNVNPEAWFTFVWRAIRNAEGYYVFQVQASEDCVAKTPFGVFESDYIDNDLDFAIKKIKNYYEGE